MGNDLWRTPNWLFRWLNELYGPFDIDLAASAENTKCAKFFTATDDALMFDWYRFGSNGFCNPPYSDLPPWLWRANYQSTIHRFKSTFVLPVWNGDKHWRYSVFESAALEITQVYGRIAFLDSSGNPVKGNRGGTVIVHYDGTPRKSANLLHIDRDELIKRYGD